MIGILVSLVGVMGITGEFGKTTSSGDGVAVIYIEGEIVSGPSDSSPFGNAAAGSDDIIQQIEKAAEDNSAKAILLRVNSPGGSAAASQEIYNAVIRAKKSGKPVIVSMADVAASGGYYVSCPADVIFANPSTMTGSIGVITMHEDLSGLLGKIGVRVETIKSGKLKDMMQPTGPISDEARQVITGVIMEVYDQFVSDVVKGRKMDRAKVLALADGRIYTGQQAKKNGLIDELGGMQEALAEAGKRGKLKGKPEIKEYGRTNLLKDLFGVRLSQPHRPVAVTGTLLYDWVAAQLVGGALQPTSTAPKVKPEGM
jgi:protease IV